MVAATLHGLKRLVTGLYFIAHNAQPCAMLPLKCMTLHDSCKISKLHCTNSEVMYVCRQNVNHHCFVYVKLISFLNHSNSKLHKLNMEFTNPFNVEVISIRNLAKGCHYKFTILQTRLL